jgi:hypothetical protein
MFLDGFLSESRRVVIAKPMPNPSALDGYA